MNDKARLDALLAEFGASIGAPQMRADERGLCAVVVDEGREISLALIDTRLTAWTEAGALPFKNLEGVLRALLEANLFWRGVDGATISLLPGTDQIVVAVAEILESLTRDGLQSLIETVANAADAVQSLVKATSSSAELPDWDLRHGVKA